MKRMFSALVLVVAVAVLSGCSGERSENRSDANRGESKPLSGDDWMSLLESGKGVECSIVENGAVMKIFAKGKVYRTETETDGRKHITVSDGKVLRNWIDGDSQGTEMKFSCMDDIRATIPDGAGPAPEYAASPEEVFGERSDAVCSETGPIEISVPDDIAFTDQCELIRSQIKAVDYFSEGILPQFPGLSEEK